MTISFTAYAFALAIGFVIDFRLTFFILLSLQVTWTLFCVTRLVQLRVRRSYRSDVESYESEDYGFALGGAVSSLALLLAFLVLTQIV
jgi:hypothetical protein